MYSFGRAVVARSTRPGTTRRRRQYWTFVVQIVIAVSLPWVVMLLYLWSR